jgi:hypothetical protein
MMRTPDHFEWAVIGTIQWGRGTIPADKGELCGQQLLGQGSREILVRIVNSCCRDEPLQD